MKNKVLFLTIPGCHNCEAAKEIFTEIMPEFADTVEVEEIDMSTPEGQEMAGRYSVMASPGIVINEELFSTGGVNKEELVAKLKSLSE
ncbi:MAG: thioredoxin family protein [Candidatus Pacebacteria bacterium]|nr:thioredoxin family protein [Candidatus Paceibacterota bacterium]